MPADTITAYGPSGTAFLMTVDTPNECPRCHAHIDPTFRAAFASVDLPSVDIRVQAVYQCTRNECRELFIVTWKYHSLQALTAISSMSAAFTFVGISPAKPRPAVFPEEIAELSPEFVRIYNQAAAAESAGLGDVAGPGFGKSLEFLVKDYLIARDPVAGPAIKHELLGATIENRVEDPKVKAVAKRAAWLRNDETHYERRLKESELSDLKMLIALTVNWIQSSILTDRIIGDMPEKGAKAMPNVAPRIGQ